MIEKGIRTRICNAIHKHATASNKYMKNYDKDNKSLCIMYLDANNLYGRIISKKLLVNSSKWKTSLPKLNRKFIHNYGEGSDKGFTL